MSQNDQKGVPEHCKDHLYIKYAPGTYFYRFYVHSKHHFGTISEHMARKSGPKLSKMVSEITSNTIFMPNMPQIRIFIDFMCILSTIRVPFWSIKRDIIDIWRIAKNNQKPLYCHQNPWFGPCYGYLKSY